jgi:hypothetical protein
MKIVFKKDFPHVQMNTRVQFLLCTFMLLLPAIHADPEYSMLVVTSNCQKVTSDVSFNQANTICISPDACVVVRNPNANTNVSCLAWSPMAYWDGKNCIGSCELLGGVVVGARGCTMPGNVDIEIPFIRCGTWLGERDSAWLKSRYQSGCVQILENRWDAGPAITSECNATRYTPGCSVPETKQTPVPLCRNSTLGTCGVATPCQSNEKCPGHIRSFLKVSELMYSLMGVHDCGWFFARDIFIVVWLFLVTAGACAQPDLCVGILFLWGLCFVWEFVLAFGLFVCCVVGVLLGSGWIPVPTKEQGGVGAQTDSTSGDAAAKSSDMQSRYEQVSGVRIEASDAFFLRSKC